MAKILITGATGFVGSHILEALMQIQHEDIQIVAACREPEKLLPHYRGEVRRGDLRDKEYLGRLLVGIDVICHAAGWSSFEKSTKTTTQTASRNYLEPTLDLINHAIEWRVSRFVNLSSVYAAATNLRNNADSQGKPRAFWPMINCHIAIEDYLREYHRPRCQFINLRLGLYSGHRLNMGLIPLLLARCNQTTLPYLSGPLANFPLIDGRDIGQAFARAAFAPFESSYSSLNIAGPETPSHEDVMGFIEDQIKSKPLNIGLPPLLADPALWLQGKIRTLGNQPLFTSAMREMLKSPIVDNLYATQKIGYDPEISWQASLLSTLEIYKNQTLNTDITQPDRSLNI